MNSFVKSHRIRNHTSRISIWKRTPKELTSSTDPVLLSTIQVWLQIVLHQQHSAIVSMPTIYTVLFHSIKVSPGFFPHTM